MSKQDAIIELLDNYYLNYSHVYNVLTAKEILEIMESEEEETKAG